MPNGRKTSGGNRFLKIAGHVLIIQNFRINAGGNVVRPSASGVDSIPAWGPYLAAYPELFDNNGSTGYDSIEIIKNKFYNF